MIRLFLLAIAVLFLLGGAVLAAKGDKDSGAVLAIFGFINIIVAFSPDPPELPK